MADNGSNVPGVRRSRSALLPGADVELEVGGRQHRAAILDVSLSGLRALRPGGVELAAGQGVQLRFPADAEQPLVLAATVVRGNEQQLAFHFEAGQQEEALRALIRRRGQLRDSCD